MDRSPMSTGDAVTLICALILSAAVSIAGVYSIVSTVWGWVTR